MFKKLFVFLLVLLILIVPIFAQATKRVAIITYLKGNVYVKKAESELWIPAKLKMELSSGDKIWVQQNSQAILEFSDRSTLKLASNTQLDILRLDRDKDTQKEVSIFKLLLGKVWATVEKILSIGERVEIHTPTAVAGVRGTEWIQQVSEDGTTVVKTLKGVVSFSAKGVTVDVKEGFQSIVKPENPPENPTPITEIEKFDEEEKPKEEKPKEEIKEEKPITPPQRGSSEGVRLALNNNLDYGLYKKNDLMLAKLSFSPELSFGILKLGLDLSLYTDGESISYIQGKIRYGELNLPWLGIKYGVIDHFTLGYGLIANRYSTYEMEGVVLRLEDPKRGGILTLFPSPFNKYENLTSTYALRAFYRPINRLEIGINGMMDMDVDENKRQAIVGADLSYFLTKNTVIYSSFAQRIIHDGVTISDPRVLSENGVALGLQSNFSLFNSVFSVQLINFSDNFYPGYFNAYYEKNKVLKTLSPLKESVNRIFGLTLDLDTNILNIAFLNVNYQSFNGMRPSIYSRFTMSLNERLKMNLLYEQKEIKTPFMLFNENTIMTLNITYPLAQNVDAILTIKRTFDPYGNPTDIYFVSTKLRL
uniref:FecR protein domain-containing protein n=1 Tax=Dictyoglomus thermophilum TaxID=14 RepID=A0A7C3MJ39_DICTH